MACDGYEHGMAVHLVRDLPDIPVPRNTKGIVQKVDSEQHRIDVYFEGFGFYAGLDAHAFEQFKDEEGGGSTISTH